MSAPSTVTSGALELAKLTPARVALGRSGASLPTSALLTFAMDHARARDAVHAPFDADALAAAVAGNGSACLRVQSRVSDRAEYLRRPDLGRFLDAASCETLHRHAGTRCDIAIVLGDGLSPGAVAAQGPAVVQALKARLSAFTFVPPVIASGARVALGDEIGEAFRASLVIMLIGERPGLSMPESLGAYLTFNPRPGLTDADRNCVSNIHVAGLSCDAAANRIAWLAREALARRVSGVALKDESAFERLPAAGS